MKNLLKNDECYDNIVYMMKKRKEKMFEYIENALHDVKTPASVIYSALQSMDSLCAATPCGNNEFARLSNIARRECFNMMRLLRDVSDVGKILDARDITFSRQNLVALVENVCDTANILGKRRNICVIFDTDSEEIYIDVNREYAERLFYNIMSNALKYSPEGGEVNTYIAICDGTARVSISNESESFSKTADIFGRYVTGSARLGSGNSGIGLAIVREIAAMFKWNVYFESICDNNVVCVVETPVLPYANISLFDFYADERAMFDLSEWLV